MDSTTTKSVKKRLREYLETSQPPAITESVWHHLLTLLRPVSESYLRDLLNECGVPFEQPYAGVRQHTLDELDQSLREMLTVYRQAMADGNHDRARYCRRQVIAAKDRAKFLARNQRIEADKRSQKGEMAEWMLVWLDNPEVFPAWVEARRKAMP